MMCASCATELPTRCPNCATEIPLAIEPDVLDAEDIVRFLDRKVSRETVNEWFHSKALNGFHLPGHRSWLIRNAQFHADFERLSRNNPPKRALQRAGKAGGAR